MRWHRQQRRKYIKRRTTESRETYAAGVVLSDDLHAMHLINVGLERWRKNNKADLELVEAVTADHIQVSIWEVGEEELRGLRKGSEVDHNRLDLGNVVLELIWGSMQIEDGKS